MGRASFDSRNREKGFDFVAPLYSRHKYDGTITNSIVYPLTRALYGKKIRQPIGGEFGFSGSLAEFYMNQDVWNTQVARFGIDIWMTTEAVANNFKICQTFLGAKIHDPKDPASSLSDMLTQVVTTLFDLTERHSGVWKGIEGSYDMPTFGFKYHVGLEPVKVSVEKMLDIFRIGAKEFSGIWTDVMGVGDFKEVESLSAIPGPSFRFPSWMWTRVVYDYALAYHRKIDVSRAPHQVACPVVPRTGQPRSSWRSMTGTSRARRRRSRSCVLSSRTRRAIS